MSRLYAQALLLGLALAIWPLAVAAASSDPARTYALVVGVAQYAEGAQPAASSSPGIENLSSSSADASSMASILLRSGLPAANLRQLEDSGATAGAIRSGLDWLGRVSEKADTVLFYFSGHGCSDVPDLDGDEAARLPGDHQDEALLPYDAIDLTTRTAGQIAASPGLQRRFLAHLITDDELFRRCSSWNCRVGVIVDACFAGGIYMDLPSSASTEALPLLRKSAHILRPADQVLLMKPAQSSVSSDHPGGLLELPDNVIFLAASQENQAAVDDRALNSGWFTYGLKTALTDAAAMRQADLNADHQVSLAEAYDYAVAEITALKSERRKLPAVLQLAGGVPDQQPLALNLSLASAIVLAAY